MDSALEDRNVVVDGEVENKQIAPRSAALPEPVSRRGISEGEWRTLFNLFPGGHADSVLLVWDYCKARGLDPMKKPCHIVPMKYKDPQGNWKWRDVVMPGIYEYRITAQRTGLYLGHSAPEYGEEIEYAGVTAPKWCAMTFYRFNPKAGERVPFPVKVWFAEVCGTYVDRETKKDVANDRWSRAPVQMLTKCAEAAGLREAFPEEFGGESTAEEMAGRTIASSEPSVEPPVAEPKRRSEKAISIETTIVQQEPVVSEPERPQPQVSSAPSPKREVLEQAGPGLVTKKVRITNTEMVPQKDGPPHYDITGTLTESGKQTEYVWRTTDEQLYRMAASCEGSESLFNVTWHNASIKGAKVKDQRVVKVISGLAAAE